MLHRQRVGMLITRPRRVFALALISVLAAFVVAGCGSSSSSSTSSTANSQDAARVKFSQCMRQNGVDIPDPGAGGGPPAGGGGQFDRSDPKVQAATKACQDKLPQRGQGGPGGPPGGGNGG